MKKKKKDILEIGFMRVCGSKFFGRLQMRVSRNYDKIFYQKPAHSNRLDQSFQLLAKNLKNLSTTRNYAGLPADSGSKNGYSKNR